MRLVQAIECVTVEQQAMFVHEIEVDVMRCVKDANGNHVGRAEFPGISSV